jgi:hypothetical protein
MNAQLIERLACEAGAGVELWATTTPKIAAYHLTPEGMQRFAQLVAEECAKVASMFSIDKHRIHPDVEFDEMTDVVQGVCHSTCQCVAQEIRAKFPLPGQ